MSDSEYIKKSDVLDLITDNYAVGGFEDYNDYSELFDAVEALPAAVTHNSETCVCCGKPIPEGRQICIECDTKAKHDGCSFCNGKKIQTPHISVSIKMAWNNKLLRVDSECKCSNHLEMRINYCPLCGRELRGDNDA